MRPVETDVRKIAKSFKEYYEKEGSIVELCSKCKLIVKIEYGKPISGPSISSGMECSCKRGEK